MFAQAPKWGVIAVVLAIGPPGCTYLGNRGHDATQMFDLGFTITRKPRFGIYADDPLVAPIGYSKLDGYYVGLGGGRFGITEHHQDNEGLILWGREKATWGSGQDKTEEDDEVGVVALAKSVASGKLSYKPACKHYLHLGWVGLAANANYYEMLDFLAGWVGLDPCKDDHREPAPTVVANPREPARYPLELLIP